MERNLTRLDDNEVMLFIVTEEPPIPEELKGDREAMNQFYREGLEKDKEDISKYVEQNEMADKIWLSQEDSAVYLTAHCLKQYSDASLKLLLTAPRVELILPGDIDLKSGFLPPAQKPENIA